MPDFGALLVKTVLASILLHLLTEFENSADLPNDGLVPDPRRQALHAIDRHANDGLPRE